MRRFNVRSIGSVTESRDTSSLPGSREPRDQVGRNRSVFWKGRMAERSSAKGVPGSKGKNFEYLATLDSKGLRDRKQFEADDPGSQGRDPPHACGRLRTYVGQLVAIAYAKQSFYDLRSPTSSSAFSASTGLGERSYLERDQCECWDLRNGFST